MDYSALFWSIAIVLWAYIAFDSIRLYFESRRRIKYLQEKIVELDFLARRYSKTPSDYLEKDISDFTFDLLVAMISTEHEKKSTERLRDKAVPRGK